MKKYSLVAAFLLAPCLVSAGAGTGKVLGYIPYSTGGQELFFIKMEQQLDIPACNTSQRLTMPASDPRFKSTQAAVLAALMAGTPVVAKGKGTCNNFGNSEDLDYVCLGNTPC